ncbi:MAG: hypothetical protein ACJ788_15130, partial [Ktedonobacteraceae bacterium]
KHFHKKKLNRTYNKNIKEKYNISSRTAYRYVHILKKRFNAPIDYDLVQGGYYLTDPGWDIVKELKNRK